MAIDVGAPTRMSWESIAARALQAALGSASR